METLEGMKTHDGPYLSKLEAALESTPGKYQGVTLTFKAHRSARNNYPLPGFVIFINHLTGHVHAMIVMKVETYKYNRNRSLISLSICQFVLLCAT